MPLLEESAVFVFLMVARIRIRIKTKGKDCVFYLNYS